jgi:hypothetical protein
MANGFRLMGISAVVKMRYENMGVQSLKVSRTKVTILGYIRSAMDEYFEEFKEKERR